MSASDSSSSIFVTDHPEDIRKKIKTYAFSGGGATLEEHRAHGCNLEVDIPYQWLKFFLDDDEKLAEIAEEYGSGRMMTGEVKDLLSDILVDLIETFQTNRAKVTDDVLAEYLKIRPLEF